VLKTIVHYKNVNGLPLQQLPTGLGSILCDAHRLAVDARHHRRFISSDIDFRSGKSMNGISGGTQYNGPLSFSLVPTAKNSDF
jgi:hypothetical protein